MTASRKLAAILAADVVGYSRMMGEDEAGTATLMLERRNAAQPIIAAHGGRLFKTMGDGMFVEFPSIVAAVECALAMQRQMAASNEGVLEAKRVLHRIGVHLGDVLVEGEDILGDGVNIASRLEGIAEPGGVCISGAAYEHVRGRIEADFIDLGEKALKNIGRQVRVYAVRIGSGPSGRALDAASLEDGPPRLSLVVLPFANIGGGEAQQHFVDGVTECLTTDLSRIAGAFVIARSTAFAYKDKPVDARRIGRDLNVRYVLEGSVQRVGERMRVNVQLIASESGAHLWAERFDKPVADLLDMQDEIVARIGNELSAKVVRVEAGRAERATNPDSLDFWFRGLDWINKGVNPEFLANARQCFERARQIDPNNVNALLGVAIADVVSAQMQSLDREVERFASAEALTLQALSQEPENATAHFCMGLILQLSKRADQGIAEFEHALVLNPNFAAAQAQIGFGKSIIGRAEETKAHIMEAMRLSPRDVTLYIWCDFLGVAKLMMGEDAEALQWFRRSVEANRTYPMGHLHYAAALALCGRSDDAGLEVKAGLALAPGFTIRRYREAALTDDPTYLVQRERIMEGMRLAGVPAG
jgi:TolB-like protein/class 3 adenylate cyclase